MKYLYILLLFTLFSCKKEVDVPNDTILVTINSNVLVHGRVLGMNDPQKRFVLAFIEGSLNSTTQLVVRPCKTYEIVLDAADTFSVDIMVSGGNGIKSYHFNSKFNNIAKQFTS